jgi:hypothetical protein
VALALARLAAICPPDPFRHGGDHVGAGRDSAALAAAACCARAGKALIRALPGKPPGPCAVVLRRLRQGLRIGVEQCEQAVVVIAAG